jgi:hypothetical protein
VCPRLHSSKAPGCNHFFRLARLAWRRMRDKIDSKRPCDDISRGYLRRRTIGLLPCSNSLPHPQVHPNESGQHQQQNEWLSRDECSLLGRPGICVVRSLPSTLCRRRRRLRDNWGRFNVDNFYVGRMQSTVRRGGSIVKIRI